MKMLHEKIVHLVEGHCRSALCLYEAEDGEVVFVGTKAEAKAHYGREW